MLAIRYGTKITVQCVYKLKCRQEKKVGSNFVRDEKIELNKNLESIFVWAKQKERNKKTRLNICLSWILKWQEGRDMEEGIHSFVNIYRVCRHAVCFCELKINMNYGSTTISTFISNWNSCNMLSINCKTGNRGPQSNICSLFITIS